MAWTFPKYIPRAGQVVDADDFNDMFEPLYGATRRLNEHNLSSDIASNITRTDVDEDASFRTMHKYNFIDASEGANPSASTPFEVACSSIWTAVPMDGTNEFQTFSSRGGMLYVCASLQYCYSYFERTVLDTSVSPAAVVSGQDDTSDVIYVQFGVRVDGAFEAVSLVGDQDELSSGLTMETGVGGMMQGVEVDIAVPITPGQHTLEIVARVQSLGGEEDRMSAYIYSTELLAWEIR